MSNGPSKSVAGRVHFFWTMLCTGLVAIPCTIAQVIGHWIDPSARTFRRWAGLWAHLTLGLSGYRLNVETAEALDSSKPYVYVSNHQSGLDIWTHLAGLPMPFGFVAKAALRKIPFVGTALRFSPSLFVDRSTPRKAVASMQEAAERIKGGNSVLIYPEGRRTWSCNVDPFLKGAFQLAVDAGVPVVPTAIVNAYRLYDERIFASKPGVIRLVIGAPIETSGLSRADVETLMNETRTFIESKMDCEG